MRFLESAPGRYDTGMRILTLGRVSDIHDAVARAAVWKRDARILEIGCGTGAVTQRLVARGATVIALDQSPEMLEQGQSRLAEAPAGSVTWVERTASEIDSLPEGSFDAVVVSLALSEMSTAERKFVLRQAARRLRPDGIFVAADEVRPRPRWERLLHAALRGPQSLLAWLLTGSVSRPIPDLAQEIREAGLGVRNERRWLLGSLAVVVAGRA
jgi:demethylmenaquinone methyltransferase/2-methoxy-6-polyprenyl-1,4-benzoquinol methylase